jgi:hypothetical protein
VVEAVIGIRDAGKTKKPPDADSLDSEPMGDGLRLGFHSAQIGSTPLKSEEQVLANDEGSAP